MSNGIESLLPCSAAEPPGLTVNSMRKKKKNYVAGKKEKHQTLTIFKEQPKHSLKNTLSRHPGLQTKDNIFE